MIIKAQKLFVIIKRKVFILTNSQVPDFPKDFLIETVASQDGQGAVLN